MSDTKDKFSKREIGLIIVIVVVIVGVGLFAWQTDKNKKTEVTDFASCAAAGNPIMESYPEQCAANGTTYTNPDQQVEIPAPNTANTQYVEVTELGVKFDKTDGMEGIYYIIETDKPNIAYFSLEELKGTDCAADKIAQVALAKWTDEDIANDEQLQMAKVSMKQIGSFYYEASGGQASCSEDEAIQAKATQLRQAVVGSVAGSLQPIN